MQTNQYQTDILSLLDKVRIFNHRIGAYRMHDLRGHDQWIVQLTNGQIYFTTDELKADRNAQLDLEMMVMITRRFEQN